MDIVKNHRLVLYDNDCEYIGDKEIITTIMELDIIHECVSKYADVFIGKYKNQIDDCGKQGMDTEFYLKMVGIDGANGMLPCLTNLKDTSILLQLRIIKENNLQSILRRISNNELRNRIIKKYLQNPFEFDYVINISIVHLLTKAETLAYELSRSAPYTAESLQRHVEKGWLTRSELIHPN